MLKLVYATDEKSKSIIGRWVIDKLFMVRNLRAGDYEAIAVAQIDTENKSSNIIAGFLFHDYCRLGDGGKIEVSMASDDPRWATPKIIMALMHYPFVQLNCHVLIAATNKTNRRARRFLTGLGFIERGIIPNRPFADDTCIYALRREDAQKWLTVERRAA